VKHIATWVGVVVMLTLGCAVLGGIIACVTRSAGAEYLVVVRGLAYEDVLLDPWVPIWFGVGRGARLGLTLGALVAACAVVGGRRVAKLRDLAVAGIGVLICMCLCSLISAGGAYLLVRFGWASLPESVGRQVGGVYRVAFSYGLDVGAIGGGFIAALIWGSFIFKRRPHVPTADEADMAEPSHGVGDCG